MKIGEKVKQWKQVAGGPILRNFLSTPVVHLQITPNFLKEGFMYHMGLIGSQSGSSDRTLSRRLHN